MERELTKVDSMCERTILVNALLIIISSIIALLRLSLLPRVLLFAYANFTCALVVTLAWRLYDEYAEEHEKEHSNTHVINNDSSTKSRLENASLQNKEVVN